MKQATYVIMEWLLYAENRIINRYMMIFLPYSYHFVIKNEIDFWRENNSMSAKLEKLEGNQGVLTVEVDAEKFNKA